MSASKERARKAGLSTSGEREAVRLVGPRQPMTKRGLSGVFSVNARAAMLLGSVSRPSGAAGAAGTLTPAQKAAETYGRAIGGVNTSDQALSQVHATLKPDGSRREIPLVLKVEGRAVEGGAVIPAGAPFSFGSETPHPADPSAGAILTFRYVVAGQQKAAILYISAATIARFASRE